MASCASQPLPPEIQQVPVAPPAVLLAPRPVPAWLGGSYGDLGAYALQLQTWGKKEEADKAAVRDFVSKASAQIAGPGH